MNSAHDLGGLDNFPSLGNIDPQDPIFHAQWEKRMMAINVAMGATGQWNIDMIRAARESLSPAQYLSNSYFEIWYRGLCKLAVQLNLATQAEIDSGKMTVAPKQVARVLQANEVQAALLKGSPANRPIETKPMFVVGQSVQTRLINPKHHTRLPRYVRGRVGVIHAYHGAHVYPDDHARQITSAHHLYTVSFSAASLWGTDTTADSVSVDCWEPYLVGA
jgi:nitrile hydratase subunit beta